MALTVFIAICIVACDFMIFVFLKLLYGEKRRGHSRRRSAGGKATKLPAPAIYVMARPENRSRGEARSKSFRRPALGKSWSDHLNLASDEERAYHRIVATFAQSPSRSS